MARKSLISIIIKDFHKIPFAIKQASFNVALFVTGWGFGTDPFYSIYINQITNHLFLVGALSSLLMFIKLFLTLPVGDLGGKVDQRKILLTGKILYMLAAVCYFFAGFLGSASFLVAGIVINGLANPMVYITYQSYIRQHSSKSISCQAFGILNAYQSIAYCGAALLSALFVSRIELHWFYIAVFAFAIISISQDLKLNGANKKPLLPEIYRSVFTNSIYIRVFRDLKSYDLNLYYTFFLQFLWGLLDFVGFLFIPILALAHDLTLPEIAVVFAIMRLPYILSFFFAEIADKRERMSILGGSFLLAAILIGILALSEGFIIILLASIALSICLAIIRPTISGVITNLVSRKQRSEITGVQEFFTTSGQIVGAFVFGMLSEAFGINPTFLGLACIVFIIGIITFFMKYYHKKQGILEFINIPMGIFHFHPHEEEEPKEPQIVTPK